MTASLLTACATAAFATVCAAFFWARATRLRYRLEQQQDANSRLERMLEMSERRASDSENTFKAIAADVVKRSADDLNRDSHQRLAAMLEPLRERIAGFERTVSETYNSEARQRFALQQVITDLTKANRDIADNARALSDALHGNSRMQGQWGEMVLETILERSGLKRGIHFVTQATTDMSGSTLTGEDDRRLRPDVILNLPDRRCLVIDSKVSLTGYLDYVESTDRRRSTMAIDRHVRSVRGHIRELAAKNYQDYIGDNRQDFVLMFIPNEGAYLAAMNACDTLWQEAYERRVLIVSPTHLISVVRLIEQLWRQDDINSNAIAIADEAGKMLGKLSDFVNDLMRVGTALDSARRSHQAALNKLTDGRGNLITRARKIEQLGAKSTKTMPASVTRHLSDDAD